MARNLPAIPALFPRHDPMRLFVSADLWRAGARYDRRSIAALAGMPLPPPYRPVPESGVWRRLLAPAGDPASWRELLYQKKSAECPWL